MRPRQPGATPRPACRWKLSPHRKQLMTPFELDERSSSLAHSGIGTAAGPSHDRP